MQNLFLLAKKKLLQDINCSTIEKRIQPVSIQMVKSEEMVHFLNGDNYCRYARIPAYYDPNKHSVVLNSGLLENLDDLTVFIVCYHELIHSASLHANYRISTYNVFQSGVKFERFTDTSYTCFNRLLNEGMVQYLTTTFNDVDYRDYAYAREVYLVKKLVSDLGLSVVKNALLYEQYTQFKLRFETKYGPDSFTQFTQALDNRNYQGAASVIGLSKTAISKQVVYNQ